MGCVHMHQGILAIEGWDSPNHIWNVMKTIRINNWKARKIDQVVSKMSAFKQKHNKIQAQHNLNIVMKSMLQHVWWCRCSKIEF